MPRYTDIVNTANELNDCIELSLLGDEVNTACSGGRLCLIGNLHETLTRLEKQLTDTILSDLCEEQAVFKIVTVTSKFSDDLALHYLL